MTTLILFLAANPTEEAQLRVGQEYKEIDAKIQASRHRDDFELKIGPGVSISDIQWLLLHHRPNILHFSGHGTQNAIALEAADGQTQMLSERALANLLEIVNRDGNIRCVFLNACYSEYQARAISRHVQCVIGMENAISDDGAREFAASFYQGLTNGRSVRDSFDLGKNILSAWNLPDEQVPKLLCGPSVDPANVFFGGKAEEGDGRTGTASGTGRGAVAAGPEARKGTGARSAPALEARPAAEDEQGWKRQPPRALDLVGTWDGSGTVRAGFAQAPTSRRTTFYANGAFEESGMVNGYPYYARGVYSFDPTRSLLAVQAEGTPAPNMLFLSDITAEGFTATMSGGTLRFRRLA